VEQKKLTVVLSVLCVLLALLSAALSFVLFSRPRFVTTTSTNPYIMFDTKTAKACWTGPATADTTSSAGPNDTDPFAFIRKNSAGIPFCSDLK